MLRTFLRTVVAFVMAEVLWPYLAENEEVPLTFWAAAGAPVAIDTLRAPYDNEAIMGAEAAVRGKIAHLEAGALSNWGAVDRYSQLQTAGEHGRGTTEPEQSGH